MGFCEYGIKDFCKKLNLDIDMEYKVSDLKSKLTIEVFLEYSSECVKIFRTIPFSHVEILKHGENNSSVARKALEYVTGKTNNERILRLFSCEIALNCLHNFEDKYPDDKRPRLAIEARLGHLGGDIGDEELASVAHTAYCAASTCYAAYYVANTANAANAANSAAYSASIAYYVNTAYYSASVYCDFCKMLRIALTDKYDTYEMFLVEYKKENQNATRN